VNVVDGYNSKFKIYCEKMKKEKLSIDLNGDYYISPSGNGTSCIASTPCFINQGLYNIWNYGSQLFIFTG
jgi:hypothetical protein